VWLFSNLLFLTTLLECGRDLYLTSVIPLSRIIQRNCGSIHQQQLLSSLPVHSETGVQLESYQEYQGLHFHRRLSLWSTRKRFNVANVISQQAHIYNRRLFQPALSVHRGHDPLHPGIYAPVRRWVAHVQQSCEKSVVVLVSPDSRHVVCVVALLVPCQALTELLWAFHTPSLTCCPRSALGRRACH
jgi:hypothetical protein